MFSFQRHAAQAAAEPLNQKLQQIRTQLQQLNQGAKPVGGEGATLGDDAPLPANKKAAIAQEETLVRGALKAVGVDYDSLIAMPNQEGTLSPYALAVKANPSLLQEVLSAPSPTLKALEVAISYQPHAEFAAKYGQDPASIKAAMRAEILAENQLGKDGTEPPAPALPFSQTRRSASQTAAKSKTGSLQDVFRK
jgi:hypothetical protein